MTKGKDGVEIEIQSDGAKHWYFHGVLHRDGGSAVERPPGEKYWFQFGKDHREDGPAIERADGTKNITSTERSGTMELRSSRSRKAEEDRPKKRPLCRTSSA
jgi:hypothetical protein